MRLRRGLAAGQHAVITGGSSGLGEALASEFVDRGLSVTLVARREGPLQEAAARLRRQRPPARVDVVTADIANAASTSALFERLDSAGLAPDVLVNSAGIMREGYFEALAPSDFTDVMDINFHGTVHAIRAALPGLIARQGRIVNIASVAGLMGVFGYTPYAAAKHALVGFTESLRYELEPRGVRVHLVCPGEFDSPMVQALDEARTPENRAHTLAIPKRSLEAVARDTVRGLERDRGRIIPGRRTAATVLGQRLAPGIGAAISRRRIRQAAGSASAAAVLPANTDGA
jgi:3-dehydrosphinganine reductase